MKQNHRRVLTLALAGLTVFAPWPVGMKAVATVTVCGLVAWDAYSVFQQRKAR